jgi:predicted TPR repeat methyltransferase
LRQVAEISEGISREGSGSYDVIIAADVLVCAWSSDIRQHPFIKSCVSDLFSPSESMFLPQVYIGDLTQFLQTCAEALKGRRGLLAFTTEALIQDDRNEMDSAQSARGWRLTISGRYSHERSMTCPVADSPSCHV